MRLGVIAGVGGVSWLGGAYYIESIVRALRANHEVLALVDARHSVDANQLAAIRFNRGLPFINRCLRLLGRPLGHRNPSLEFHAKSHGIDAILPLSSSLGARCSVPWIGWIPDFQHLEQPRWFAPEEARGRDVGFGRLCAEVPLLLLSSHHAESVALRTYSSLQGRTSVARFAAALEPESWNVNTGPLRSEYGIDEPYVYLPNQFWVHKNHRTVFRAWTAIGKKAPLLVCTGNVHDPRSPGHLSDLQRELDGAARERVRILGIIPRPHQLALYRCAGAVLNPSLYEGWSTTVEEALAFGRKLLLSDISLFHEQAGEDAVYFAPEDPQDLGRRVEQLATTLRRETEPAAELAGRSHHARRQAEFRQALDRALEGVIRLHQGRARVAHQA